MSMIDVMMQSMGLNADTFAHIEKTVRDYDLRMKRIEAKLDRLLNMIELPIDEGLDNE